MFPSLWETTAWFWLVFGVIGKLSVSDIPLRALTLVKQFFYQESSALKFSQDSANRASFGLFQELNPRHCSAGLTFTMRAPGNIFETFRNASWNFEPHFIETYKNNFSVFSAKWAAAAFMNTNKVQKGTCKCSTTLLRRTRTTYDHHITFQWQTSHGHKTKQEKRCCSTRGPEGDNFSNVLCGNRRNSSFYGLISSSHDHFAGASGFLVSSTLEWFLHHSRQLRNISRSREDFIVSREASVTTWDIGFWCWRVRSRIRRRRWRLVDSTTEVRAMGGLGSSMLLFCGFTNFLQALQNLVGIVWRSRTGVLLFTVVVITSFSFRFQCLDLLRTPSLRFPLLWVLEHLYQFFRVGRPVSRRDAGFSVFARPFPRTIRTAFISPLLRLFLCFLSKKFLGNISVKGFLFPLFAFVVIIIFFFVAFASRPPSLYCWRQFWTECRDHCSIWLWTLWFDWLQRPGGTGLLLLCRKHSGGHPSGPQGAQTPRRWYRAPTSQLQAGPVRLDWMSLAVWPPPPSQACLHLWKWRISAFPLGTSFGSEFRWWTSTSKRHFFFVHLTTGSSKMSRNLLTVDSFSAPASSVSQAESSSQNASDAQPYLSVISKAKCLISLLPSSSVVVIISSYWVMLQFMNWLIGTTRSRNDRSEHDFSSSLAFFRNFFISSTSIFLSWFISRIPWFFTVMPLVFNLSKVVVTSCASAAGKFCMTFSSISALYKKTWCWKREKANVFRMPRKRDK